MYRRNDPFTFLIKDFYSMCVSCRGRNWCFCPSTQERKIKCIIYFASKDRENKSYNFLVVLMVRRYFIILHVPVIVSILLFFKFAVQPALCSRFKLWKGAKHCHFDINLSEVYYGVEASCTANHVQHMHTESVSVPGEKLDTRWRGGVREVNYISLWQCKRQQHRFKKQKQVKIIHEEGKDDGWHTAGLFTTTLFQYYIHFPP